LFLAWRLSHGREAGRGGINPFPHSVQNSRPHLCNRRYVVIHLAAGFFFLKPWSPTKYLDILPALFFSFTILAAAEVVFVSQLTYLPTQHIYFPSIRSRGVGRGRSIVTATAAAAAVVVVAGLGGKNLAFRRVDLSETGKLFIFFFHVFFFLSVFLVCLTYYIYLSNLVQREVTKEKREKKNTYTIYLFFFCASLPDLSK